MGNTTAPHKIHALIGVTKLPDETFRNLLDASLKGLLANITIYSKTPVDLNTYGSTISAFEESIPAALDGSRTAIALTKKLRSAAERMYVELAHYVEANCKDDMQTFLLSGFQPKSSTKAPSQPPDVPAFSSVTPGPGTGQMKAKVKKEPRAVSYVIRRGPVPPGGGPPATWTEQILPNSKLVIIDGLTPGTVYSFQVKAIGAAGSTDWSDPVNRMAT